MSCIIRASNQLNLVKQFAADSSVQSVFFFFLILHFNLLFHASDAMNLSTRLANRILVFCLLKQVLCILIVARVDEECEHELVKIKSILGFP